MRSLSSSMADSGNPSSRTRSARAREQQAALEAKVAEAKRQESAAEGDPSEVGGDELDQATARLQEAQREREEAARLQEAQREREEASLFGGEDKQHDEDDDGEGKQHDEDDDGLADEDDNEDENHPLIRGEVRREDIPRSDVSIHDVGSDLRSLSCSASSSIHRLSVGGTDHGPAPGVTHHGIALGGVDGGHHAEASAQQDTMLASMQLSLGQMHERIKASSETSSQANAQLAQSLHVMHQQLIASNAHVAQLTHVVSGLLRKNVERDAQEKIPFSPGDVIPGIGITPAASSTPEALPAERSLGGPHGRPLISASSSEAKLAELGPQVHQQGGTRHEPVVIGSTAHLNQETHAAMRDQSDDSRKLHRVQNELVKLVNLSGKPGDTVTNRQEALKRVKAVVFDRAGVGKLRHISLVNASKKTLIFAYHTVGAMNRAGKSAVETLNFVFINVLSRDSTPEAPLRVPDASCDNLVLKHSSRVCANLDSVGIHFVTSLRKAQGIEVVKGATLEFTASGDTVTSSQKKAVKRCMFVKDMLTFGLNMTEASRAISVNIRQVHAIQISAPEYRDLYTERLQHLEKLIHAVHGYIDRIDAMQQQHSADVALMFHLAHGRLMQQTNCFYTGDLPRVMALAQIWAKTEPPADLVKGLPKDPRFKKKKGKKKKGDEDQAPRDKSKLKCSFQLALGRCPRANCTLNHDFNKDPKNLNKSQRRYLQNALKQSNVKDEHDAIRAALAIADEQ